MQLFHVSILKFQAYAWICFINYILLEKEESTFETYVWVGHPKMMYQSIQNTCSIIIVYCSLCLFIHTIIIWQNSLRRMHRKWIIVNLLGISVFRYSFETLIRNQPLRTGYRLGFGFRKLRRTLQAVCRWTLQTHREQNKIIMYRSKQIEVKIRGTNVEHR